VKFLLDTNVVSEWVKPQPNERVIKWLDGIAEDDVFLSAVTMIELRCGVELLAAGTRRTKLDRWMQDELPYRFEGRIVVVDTLVADACGKLLARRKKSGRPVGAMDAIIAATADVHGFTVATRNVDDFDFISNRVVDPWTVSTLPE